MGEWEYKQYDYSTGRYTTHYVSFRGDGSFISSTIGYGGSYGLVGDYSVNNGWITLDNVVVKIGSGAVEEDWLKTYRVEYRFKKVSEVNLSAW